MSKLVANYSGGASDEYGTFKSLNEAFIGQVFKGLDTAPNATPNMTVKVNPGSGRIPTGTVPSDYYYMISHDTVGGESVTIATAAASPRIDYVVAYVDKGVTPSLTPVNNANNLLKFAAVAGTPAGSPVAPTTAQIQTAIGAANPYIILSQIAVAASVTTITTPNITDLRQMIQPTYNLIRQNDVTNITETGGRILTGWGVIIPGASTVAQESVIFNKPFTNQPIVTLTYGGDAISATTYGAGGINVNVATASGHTVTSSSFVARIQSTGGAWSAGNAVFYQWIAIGL